MVMKSLPLISTPTGFIPSAPNEATHLWFVIPGPIGHLHLPVMIGGTRAGTNNWTWNGDVDRPTLKPSILSEGGPGTRSHIWLNDGKCQFLEDSIPELAGQTLDLIDLNESNCSVGPFAPRAAGATEDAIH